MSKLGNINLELQDQANELGFETVQEALDHGFKIQPTARLEFDEDNADALVDMAYAEEAEGYNKRCQEIAQSLRDAAKFIEEECHGR